MPQRFALAALAALLPLAFAIPAPEAHRQGFTVTQEDTGEYKYLSGPMAMEAMYVKYGRPVPPTIKKAAAAAASQQGSVSASPEKYDTSFLCPVYVGTPGQGMFLDFDTGSSDFWVFSSEQPSAQRSGHTYIYNTTKSSTAKLDSGETWSITYADDSTAKGNVYFDKVVIGGVTATSQAVECATSVSSQFVSDTQSSGLVGFAFDDLNTGSPTKLQTWFGNIQASLPTPIFAAYLRKGVVGAYDFGYINSTRYTGSIAYTDVDSKGGYWGLSTSGYSVGTTAYSASIHCIADTGSTLIYLPDAVVKNYYAAVSGATNSATYGGYIFPCSATLPDFAITIGGASHVVPGSYLNYSPETSTQCFGGLQSSGVGDDGDNVLGDIFLKSQYVVFDMAVPRIGFAAQSGK